MDRHLAVYAAGAALVLVMTASAAEAWASGWLPPVGGATFLAFGAVYPGGTHRGVDLAAEEGATVSSPADAVVTFAGAVPADGGGTCGAVTLELSDGLRVSLLPFDDVGVVEGDSVQAGDSIGTVASSGDDSSAPVHLHVGLRRGDLYLDPAAFLAPPVTAEPEGARQTAVVLQAPAESAGSAAGGTVSAAALHASAELSVVPSAGEASDGVVPVTAAAVAPVAASASRLVARQPTREAGIPRPSSVVVRSANEMSRPSAHLGLPVTRAVTAWLLALGMFGVGVSIILVRRASPVHAR